MTDALTASVTLMYDGGTCLPCLLASWISAMSHTLNVVPLSCAQTSFHPSSFAGFWPSGWHSRRRMRGPEKYILCACARVSCTTERISGCNWEAGFVCARAGGSCGFDCGGGGGC